MKTMLSMMLTGLIGLTSLAHATPVAKIDANSPDQKKVGYGFGYIMGKSNVEAVKDLDVDAFIQGFKDGYGGVKPALSEEQIKTAILQYKQNQDAAEMKAFKQQADSNLKTGSDFLANNAKKAGITTTASGLQYQVIKAGTGAKPKKDSKVTVHYEGRLVDGTVFDSSIARGEPMTLPLDQVIPGWTEGVQLMQEGAKYRFFIPAKLGYGETGSGDIPPNSVLIFEIELIKIEK